MKTDNSRLETRDGRVVSYIGQDGITLFQAITLRSALRLWAEHRMLVNRQWTPTLMLTVAGRFSGKTYKRGEHALAAEDVQKWIDAMRAALPVVELPPIAGGQP